MSTDVDPTAIDLEVDPEHQRMRGVAVHGHTPFDVPFISPITTNLWQGGCQNGLVLPRSIKHVISLYPWESYDVHERVDSYVAVKLYDSRDMPDTSQLAVLAAWVNNCRAAAPTLVHCQAGLNRSALLSALALMSGPEKLSGYDAITLLREKRSQAVLCNRTFEAWLLSLGKLDEL